MALRNYLPQDRARALARSEELPEQASGSALFADIAGFTALTESLTQRLGERRGVEALCQRINAVYDRLVQEVERRGGSVIGFAGDAITCWFDERDGPAAARAARCGLDMQARLVAFNDLTLKVAVASGAARRFIVGEPDIQLLDVLAGATLSRVAAAEGLARPGDVLIDEATARDLQASVGEARRAADGECFWPLDPGWVGGSDIADTAASTESPDEAQLRRWVLPFVADREAAEHGLFATDLRPASALFMRFAGLDYDHDPQAPQQLHGLVADAQRVVQRHGGVLLELTVGDKGSYLYASFGAAQVHEDDPARAVRAALMLCERWGGDPWRAQIGLSSGTMRVGGYGGRTRQSFGAMGDDVNAAARLMGLARPGEILISGRVRQAVGAEFTLEPRPPITLKGKTEPLPVFAVLGRHQQRAMRLQEPAFTLPMVGRDREAALLAERLAAAARGEGQIVGLVAEAGMGKSRLVAEGVRLARRQKWVGYGGSCQMDGLHTPYLVWQPIFMALFDLDPELPLRKQRRAIELTLDEYAPEHADAWPLLGMVLGLDLGDNGFTAALSPKDRRALLEALLLKCLESAAHEAAEDGPGLLLVLEDLHAVDPLSLDLLLQLARSVPSLAILVLVTYRPPDLDAPPGAAARLATLPGFTEIELAGLADAQAEQVVRAKLAAMFPQRSAAVPPALVARIAERAQGNPFYIEEVLNYLHDRGIDPHVDAALQALDLPASLHSLVLSRIDQLRLSQQLSLKVASVIGRVFRASDLQGYHPALGSAESVRADLDVLDRLGLTPLESPDPELSYLFKHRVTLEVGYQSLPHATRVRLHGEFARYLESRHADRSTLPDALLAHHYLRAEIDDKACHHLRKAGEQAAAAYANEQALEHFALALARLPAHDTAARADVLLRCEALHDLLGQHEQRQQSLDAVQSLVPSGGAEATLLQTTLASRRAKLAIDLGDYAAARAHAERAVRSIEAQPALARDHATLRIAALLLVARALFCAGEAAAARPTLDQALVLAREHGDLRGECQTLSQTGLLHWHVGDYAAAQDWLLRALRLIEQVGDARAQIDVLNNLGVVAKARAAYGEAVAHYEQAQRLARKIGDRSGEAMLLNNMGSACLVAGDFGQALQHAEQAARLFEAVQEPAQLALALINRAEAHRELGQYGPAQALSEQALTLLRSSGLRRGEAIVLENLGLIAYAEGRWPAAAQATQAALALARDIGSRALEASTLHHLGQIHIAAHQLDAAAAVLHEAAALALELDAELPALEIAAARAQLCLARGGPEAADEARARLAALLPLLLQPGTDDHQAGALPLSLHAQALRVLQACGDERAAALGARARAELQARAARIADAGLRRSYLGIREHRAIAEGQE